MNKNFEQQLFTPRFSNPYNFSNKETSKQQTNNKQNTNYSPSPSAINHNQGRIKIISTAYSNNIQSQDDISQRQLLNYSNSTQNNPQQDYSSQFKKLMYLMSSKQNIKNHASQSLLLHGYNSVMSKQIGEILSKSFVQYIPIAKNMYNKILNEQLTLISSFHQNISTSNLKSKQLESKQNTKILSIKNNLQASQCNPTKNIMNLLNKKIQQQLGRILQKMVLFESKIYEKLGQFQNSLIKITLLKNNILQDRINDNVWQQNYKKIQKQNKRLMNLIKDKDYLIQQYIIKIKTISRSQKDHDIKQLNMQLKYVRKELEDQKNLYDSLIQKNLRLQKQLYMLSYDQNGSNSNDQNQSFQIVQKSQINCLTQSVASISYKFDGQ